MYQNYCALLVLLGAAFANGVPVWFYNTGAQNIAPTVPECLSFTQEYDPFTGYISYRCSNPNIQNIPIKPIPDNALLITDMESDEDDSPTPSESLQTSSETLQTVGGRSRGSPQHVKATYGSLISGRSRQQQQQRPWKKNKKTKRPSNSSSRRNQCPVGQIYQSELDICIDYPSAPPLPPKRLSISRLTPYDSMMADAPLRTSALNQKTQSADLQKTTPASGTILAVGKFDLKNRCQPDEIYVSEIDICLPKNNCLPYSKTC